MNRTLTYCSLRVRESRATIREPEPETVMIKRREFLGVTAGAGATLALAPELLRALHHSGETLIQRAVPSSGEKLQVIGLSFSNHVSCADPAALREVFKTFVDNAPESS